MTTKMIVFVTILTLATFSFGSKAQVIYNFHGSDGDLPQAGVITDGAGNLYGVTEDGGTGCVPDFCGTVYQLSLVGGVWTETVLHNFTHDGTDGFEPQTKLVRDSAGNLYGTTPYGGTGQCGTLGCGVVFEISPSGQETILHQFANDGTDGVNPWGGLVIDSGGNLYGTTVGGGSASLGTVFELSNVAGKWTETVLHSFGQGTDGVSPIGCLIIDSAGMIYGATELGGTGNYGTIFQIAQGQEKVLYNFTNGPRDGEWPIGDLVMDSSGNLYGVNSTRVFRLRAKVWTLRTLYKINMLEGITLDKTRNVYGTTMTPGTAFELRPVGTRWTKSLLWRMYHSTGGMAFDSSGYLYGTEQGSKRCNQEWCGQVYEIQP